VRSLGKANPNPLGTMIVSNGYACGFANAQSIVIRGKRNGEKGDKEMNKQFYGE
jgi:hypothetical protein